MHPRLTSATFRAPLGLIVLGVFGSTSAEAGDSPWVVTPGLGHDQFEQTFFLEDTVGADPDSLKTLKRTIEELKESYASLEGAYDRGKTRIANTVYATDVAWRNVFTAKTRFKSLGFKFDANGRFEWKGNDERDSVSSEYTYGQLALTPRYEWGVHWAAFTRLDLEGTNYAARSLYGLDYGRTRIRVGARFTGELLETLEMTIGGTSREVPDSTRLSYEELWWRVEASYWEWGPSQWSAEISLTDRDYDEGGMERNHSRVVSELESDWRVAKQADFRALLEWEMWNYGEENDIYYDFHTGELEWRFEYDLSDAWGLGAISRTSWENATSDSFAVDDYSELGLGPILTWCPAPLIWIEMASYWGRRSYNDASLIYDDYRFVQFDIRADGSLGQHLTLTLSATYEEESHDDPIRDAEYTYGSFALRFPFRL